MYGWSNCLVKTNTSDTTAGWDVFKGTLESEEWGDLGGHFSPKGQKPEVRLCPADSKEVEGNRVCFFLSLCKVRFQREQKFKANFESWNIEEETLYPRVDRLIITQQLLCLAECVSNRSSLTAFGLFWKLSVKSKLHFLTWILPLKLCQCNRNSVSFLNVAQPPWGSQ